MSSLMDGPYTLKKAGAFGGKSTAGHPSSMSRSIMDAFTQGEPPAQIGTGAVTPPQSFMDASQAPTQEMMTVAPEGAEGMSGMQKAAIGAQLGGGVSDALMRMQTRAPAARGAQMNFRRQGPSVAELFMRGRR